MNGAALHPSAVSVVPISPRSSDWACAWARSFLSSETATPLPERQLEVADARRDLGDDRGGLGLAVGELGSGRRRAGPPGSPRPAGGRRAAAPTDIAHDDGASVARPASASGSSTIATQPGSGTVRTSRYRTIPFRMEAVNVI